MQESRIIVRKAALWQTNPFLEDLRKNLLLWLMILPALFYFLIFKYLPMIGVVLAFKDFNIRLGVIGSPWIGFDNFAFLFKSGTLWTITRNTVLYNLVFIFLGNILEIFVAILLSGLTIKWFKKVSQSVMFLPHFVSFVILSAFIYNIFNYEYGTLNSLLTSLGMEPVDVYNNKWAWKYILVIFYVWKSVGYGSVIYLAAITGIDASLYEAAKVDGASAFQQIRHITLPLLKPTVAILILLAVGRIMHGQFELFYQVVGGNSQLYPTTDIIDTYVFRSLAQNFDVGMGAAAGFYQSLTGLVIIVVANYAVKKLHEEYALF